MRVSMRNKNNYHSNIIKYSCYLDLYNSLLFFSDFKELKFSFKKIVSTTTISFGDVFIHLRVCGYASMF